MAEASMYRAGFQAPREQTSAWRWGDITLLNQVNLVNRYAASWSVQPMVRFPTSRNASLEDYFESSSDEGQVDVGLTSLTDFRRRNWIVGARVGYIVQLPDAVRTRTLNSSATGIVDKSLDRDLGDYGLISVDAEYELSKRWDVSLEHTFLAKEKDRLQNAKSLNAPLSTAELGEQRLHQSRFELLYHFGGEGLRRGITQEWKAALAYAYPWAGRNSSKQDRASVELISYF